MKLKDILKTDTDNTGWLKTFKKLGADREMLQYVNNNISKGGGGDVNKKYGYYRIIPDIFDIVSEGRSAIITVCIELLKFVGNIELNGRTSFSRLSGVDGYINCPIAVAIIIYLSHPDSLAYSHREYFNLGIMVDESDSSPILIINHNSIDIFPKGTLLERLEQAGQTEMISYFIPITKEEYESLSDEFKQE